jgi:nucleoside-diphosphate-sugar epimerase
LSPGWRGAAHGQALEKLMSAHVLVTGGAGYIGSILCECLLDAGHKVTAVDNLMYGQHSLFHLCAHRDFQFVAGDARDERLMRRLVAEADVLIPLAAVVGAPACDRDPWLARSVNLEAVRMLNRLRSPRQLVVYPNTNSGYGIKTSDQFCTEDTRLEPISLYGKDKVQAELELLQSPNTITLRLATVFGMSSRMRLDLLVNHFVYAAVTDGYLVIFEKDFKRNYVHVRDVADCFAYCVAHAPHMTGRAYNLGLDAANLSKAELAMKIKQHVPRFFLHFAEVGSDPDKRNYIVSNQRLREAGFEARRSLDDGIRELLTGYSMFGRGLFRNI